jgi:hypothetical protein
MIERRGCVLLGFCEQVELSLLRCGRLKLEDHAVEAGFGIDGAEVKLRTSERVHIAGEGDGLGFVQDGSGCGSGWNCVAGGGDAHGAKNEECCWK